jgi:hypothetical protein
MRAPLTIGSLTLRFLTLRDWNDLTYRWLAARQQEHEQALRRAGASALEIAQAVQDYASKRSAYSLLLEMCKTYDGGTMILERAAQNAGVEKDALYASLEGLDPDAVAILAMRACGWEIKAQGDEGNG